MIFVNQYYVNYMFYCTDFKTLKFSISAITTLFISQKICFQIVIRHITIVHNVIYHNYVIGNIETHCKSVSMYIKIVT